MFAYPTTSTVSTAEINMENVPSGALVLKNARRVWRMGRENRIRFRYEGIGSRDLRLW